MNSVFYIENRYENCESSNFFSSSKLIISLKEKKISLSASRMLVIFAEDEPKQTVYLPSFLPTLQPDVVIWDFSPIRE